VSVLGRSDPECDPLRRFLEFDGKDCATEASD